MRRRDGSRLAHPRMLRRLSQTHFNNVATIGTMTIVYDDFNQPIDQIFTPSDIPELTNIPCYKEPLGEVGKDQEYGKPNQIVITDKFNVALAGYFPQIRTEDVIRINERLYDITGVASDDTNTITFLNVKVVNASVIEAS